MRDEREWIKLENGAGAICVEAVDTFYKLGGKFFVVTRGGFQLSVPELTFVRIAARFRVHVGDGEPIRVGRGAPSPTT